MLRVLFVIGEGERQIVFRPTRSVIQSYERNTASGSVDFGSFDGTGLAAQGPFRA